MSDDTNLQADAPDEVGLTARIVSAYVSNNTIGPANLVRLVGNVHAAISGLTRPDNTAAAPAEKPAPAVPIKKSVTPDYIVCLEDGRKYKSLKRHLRIRYNMTPDEYRAKWKLPSDYPMIAPSYSQQRSQLAKKTGLGRKR